MKRRPIRLQASVLAGSVVAVGLALAALADVVWLLWPRQPLAGWHLDGLGGFGLVTILPIAAFATWAAPWFWLSSLVATLGGALCLGAETRIIQVAGLEVATGVVVFAALEADRGAALVYAGLAGLGALLFLGPATPAITALGAAAILGSLPRALPALPPCLAATIAAGLPVMALSLVLRAGLPISMPVPGGWGGAAMLAGSAASVFAATCSNLATELRPMLAWTTLVQGGATICAAGVAIVARSADLPALTALALAAALLLALSHALGAALLHLGAGALQVGAGSQHLDRLGGLAQRMPLTAGCVLVAAAGAAWLPLTGGFGALWMLLQALFALPRAGGVGLSLATAVAVGLMALAVGISASAMVRMVGTAMLGRPRTPRAAAAEEPRRSTPLVVLAGLAAGLGVLPVAGLALAAPALRLLAGDDMATRAGLAGLRAQEDGSLYAPLALLAFLLAGLGLARLATGGSARRVPRWDGGLGPPAPWLPFGDPATQASAAGQSAFVRDALRGIPATVHWPRTVPPQLIHACGLVARCLRRPAWMLLAGVVALLVRAATW